MRLTTFNTFAAALWLAIGAVATAGETPLAVVKTVDWLRRFCGLRALCGCMFFLRHRMDSFHWLIVFSAKLSCV